MQRTERRGRQDRDGGRCNRYENGRKHDHDQQQEVGAIKHEKAHFRHEEGVILSATEGAAVRHWHHMSASGAAPATEESATEIGEKTTI